MIHKTTQASIQDIAYGGKGVARVEGRVIFIPFTLEGETVEAEIVSERKSFAEGRLARVLTPSTERVSPPCPYFTRCGGCAYQHASYLEQLRIKRHQVAQALSRIGKIQADVAPCVPSPEPYGYRNRITVHASDHGIGFFAADRHVIVDIERCLLAGETINQQLSDLRARGPRDGHFTLRDQPGDRTFRQTNDAVAELLAKAVGEALPSEGPLLIDAYCGSGFFLKRFRQRFARLTGIEWNKHAIAQARQDAADNEHYLPGDVALHLAEALTNQPAGTVLLLDPPSEGLDTNVIRAILKNPPDHLLHISCNPSTLARDLGKLSATYDVQHVTPFDMFPQTAEIEVLAVLRKKN